VDSTGTPVVSTQTCTGGGWVGCGSGGLANSSTPSLQLAKNKSVRVSPSVLRSFVRVQGCWSVRARVHGCGVCCCVGVVVLSWYARVYRQKCCQLVSHIKTRPKYHGTHVRLRNWRYNRDVWPVGMLQTVRNLSTVSSAARGIWKQPLLVKLSRQLKTVI
jgi:hypothetical protein